LEVNVSATKRKHQRKSADSIRTQNFQRVSQLLKKLGVLHDYAKIPGVMRQQIPEHLDAKTIFVYDESTPQKIKDAVEVFKTATVSGISFYDFVEVSIPISLGLLDWMESHQSRRRISKLGYSDGVTKRVSPPPEASKISEALHELNFAFVKSLFSFLVINCVDCSSLEIKSYFPNFQYVLTDKGNKQRLQVKILSQKAESERIKIDGDCLRTVFRVGGTEGSPLNQSWRWLEKDPQEFTFPGKPGEKLPVYVQPHVFRRLEERLDDPKLKHIFSSSIYKSLTEKFVVARAGEHTVLVPFVMGHPPVKTGYLAVTKLPKMILVKTFLFLTLESTPEGRKLSRIMGWDRDEVAYHKLDRVSTFLKTDLIDSPPFIERLELAGLEAFLDWVGAFRKDHTIRPFAEELIQYFRLDKIRA
jgi:hypothetical protein